MTLFWKGCFILLPKDYFKAFHIFTISVKNLYSFPIQLHRKLCHCHLDYHFYYTPSTILIISIKGIPYHTLLHISIEGVLERDYAYPPLLHIQESQK